MYEIREVNEHDDFNKLPHYHENLDALRVNTMPKRAYYIPYPELDTALTMDREKSGELHMLGGNWWFKYYDSYLDVTDLNKFDTQIPVPSNWEMHGFGWHNYVNTKYQIPYNPPYVPDDTPCGVYQTRFHADSYDDMSIVFEGVASCFYLYINGRFVGYAQATHNMSEFDITPYLHIGGNTVTVVVLKWCDGTYIEAQDMFRMSGIFRDVYVLDRPKERIRDFVVRQRFEDDYKKAFVDVELTADGEVEYSIAETGQSGKATGSFCVEIENPRLWTAETPELYTLVLSMNGEYIVQKVGLRELKIKDGVLYLNGHTFKVKGVNRHDTDPEHGYAVTRKDMLRDLKLMKQHNVNAIRTSHYPNSPMFYEMCNELGFYVMDEADYETHGIAEICEGSNFSRSTQEEKYFKAIHDRIESLVIRDRNQSCVCFWSMGNEAGFGPNVEKVLRWTKETDPSRPTHYESIEDQDHHPDRWCYYVPNHEDIDIYSGMYHPYDKVDAYCRGAWRHQFSGNKKPYIMCEYSFGQGNEVGDLEDYQQVFYKYDNAIGGFFWEWSDHAVYDGDENGRKRMLYGGDFGELIHSGTDCVNGLTTPDRQVTEKLIEYKNVMRPARITEEDGKTVVRNRMDFVNLKDYAVIEYEVIEGGKVVKTGTLDDLDILPHEAKTFELTGEIVNFNIYAKNDSEFIKKGDLLGTDQIKNEVMTPDVFVKTDKADFTEDERYVYVNVADMEYTFDKRKCVFTSAKKCGKEMLDAPMEYNIWRTPVGNKLTNPAGLEWRRAGYDRAFVKQYDCRVENGEIYVKFALTAIVNRPIMDMEARCFFDEDGRLRMEVEGRRNILMEYLPRFGMRLFLSDAMDKVTYDGYGPYESYVDKHHSCRFGTYTSTADEMHEDYVVPQENGSRWGVERLAVTDGSETISVTADKEFCFNLSHYTQEELDKKMHNFELEKSGHTVLCIDGAQSGVGAGALTIRYQMIDPDVSFAFNLKF